MLVPDKIRKILGNIERKIEFNEVDTIKYLNRAISYIDKLDDEVQDTSLLYLTDKVNNRLKTLKDKIENKENDTLNYAKYITRYFNNQLDEI